MFTKGDIILPVKKVGRSGLNSGLFHPAIVWEDFQEGDFLGIMLTHSSPNSRYQNILMEPCHFEEGFEFSFSNTHFVNQLFVKFYDWGPFVVRGRISKEGIFFLEKNLTNRDAIDFVTYLYVQTEIGK